MTHQVKFAEDYLDFDETEAQAEADSAMPMLCDQCGELYQDCPCQAEPSPRDRALKIVTLLKEARLDLAGATREMAQAARDMEVMKAIAETKLIHNGGGEKALGSNQAARERVLIAGIQTDPPYLAALECYEEVADTREALKIEVKGYEEQLKVLLAFADSGQT